MPTVWKAVHTKLKKTHTYYNSNATEYSKGAFTRCTTQGNASLIGLKGNQWVLLHHHSRSPRTAGKWVPGPFGRISSSDQELIYPRKHASWQFTSEFLCFGDLPPKLSMLSMLRANNLSPRLASRNCVKEPLRVANFNMTELFHVTFLTRYNFNALQFILVIQIRNVAVFKDLSGYLGCVVHIWIVIQLIKAKSRYVYTVQVPRGYS